MDTLYDEGPLVKQLNFYDTHLGSNDASITGVNVNCRNKMNHHNNNDNDNCIHNKGCCTAMTIIITRTNLFCEPSAEGCIHKFEYTETYFKGTSAFQEVEVVNTSTYGRMLVLDSQVQSSAIDEFIYHETLVHPALLSLKKPAERVFIGGGGEGATLREVLRHKSVKECVMVDIDPLVCKAAYDHMQQWHDGAFDDARTKLVVDDAKKILETYPDGYFDVIILDLSDPLDYGPCYKLYTTEFYTICRQKLNQQSGGAFVTQSGPASVHTATDCYTAIHKTLQQVFPMVAPYVTHIPSFTNQWGFNMGLFNGSDAEADNILFFNNGDRDLLIKERLQDGVELKHYDALTHKHVMTLPKYIRKVLKDEERIICEATPIFVSHVKCAVEGSEDAGNGNGIVEV